MVCVDIDFNSSDLVHVDMECNSSTLCLDLGPCEVIFIYKPIHDDLKSSCSRVCIYII